MVAASKNFSDGTPQVAASKNVFYRTRLVATLKSSSLKQ